MAWLLALFVVVSTIVWFRCGKKGRGNPYWKGAAHYRLLLYNSQGRIEWVIRTLLRSSFWNGKDFSLSYVDYGSTDHTLAIIQRISQQRKLIWSTVDETDGRDLVVIDLRYPRDSYYSDRNGYKMESELGR